MSKRQLSIEEHSNTAGVYTIIINNARYQKNFFKFIERIFEDFLLGNEVFFGFYRTDGINLSLVQQNKLKNEIPDYFHNNGDMNIISEYLTVARIKSKNYNYSFISLIFDYYLQTVMFNPQVDWEIFKQYHSNYLAHRFDEIVLNHFAEIIFYYIDSGDFAICFNPVMYDPKVVRRSIQTLFSKTENTEDASLS